MANVLNALDAQLTSSSNNKKKDFWEKYLKIDTTGMSKEMILLKKLEIWSGIGVAAAIIGAVCFIISHETMFSSLDHSSPTWCLEVPEPGVEFIVVLLQLVLTLSTFVVVLSSVQYWKTQHHLSIYSGEESPREMWWKCGAYRFGLVEGIIVLIHCPPGVRGCIYAGRILTHAGYAMYDVQSISLIVLLTRLHLILRFLLHHNYFSQRRVVTRMFDMPPSQFTGIKLMVQNQPLQFLGVFTVITILLFAYIFLVFERASDHRAFFNGSDLNQYWDNRYDNCMWFIWVVMTTVGFGDIYPLTTGGRFTAAFANALGMVITALLIGAVSNELAVSEIENKVSIAIRCLDAKKNRRPNAARFAFWWWMYKRHPNEENELSMIFARNGWRKQKKSESEFVELNQENVRFHVQELKLDVSLLTKQITELQKIVDVVKIEKERNSALFLLANGNSFVKKIDLTAASNGETHDDNKGNKKEKEQQEILDKFKSLLEASQSATNVELAYIKEHMVVQSQRQEYFQLKMFEQFMQYQQDMAIKFEKQQHEWNELMAKLLLQQQQQTAAAAATTNNTLDNNNRNTMAFEFPPVEEMHRMSLVPDMDIRSPSVIMTDENIQDFVSQVKQASSSEFSPKIEDYFSPTSPSKEMLPPFNNNNAATFNASQPHLLHNPQTPSSSLILGINYSELEKERKNFASLANVLPSSKKKSKNFLTPLDDTKNALSDHDDLWGFSGSGNRKSRSANSTASAAVDGAMNGDQTNNSMKKNNNNNNNNNKNNIVEDFGIC